MNGAQNLSSREKLAHNNVGEKGKTVTTAFGQIIYIRP